MAKTVVALYREFDTAEKVVRELVDDGFRREDISLVAQDRTQGSAAGTGHEAGGTEAGSHAAAGAGAGAVVGGLAGLVVGLGVLAIPGLGPLIAAGPLAATLAGAGVGAVAGGLIGALTGAGVSEEDARAFAEGVRQGGTLVTVHAADDRAAGAAAIMNRHNPIDLRDRSQPVGEAGRALENATPMAGAEFGGMAADESERPYHSFESDFHQHYDLFYSSRGQGYQYYEPGYRYGYDLAGMDRFHGQRWNEIEPDARRQWEETHPDLPWDNFREAIRHGWERRMSSQDATAAGQGDVSSFHEGTEYYDSGAGEGRYRDPNNP